MTMIAVPTRPILTQLASPTEYLDRCRTIDEGAIPQRTGEISAPTPDRSACEYCTHVRATDRNGLCGRTQASHSDRRRLGCGRRSGSDLPIPVVPPAPNRIASDSARGIAASRNEGWR